MDLRRSDEDLAFLDDLRSFLDSNAPPEAKERAGTLGEGLGGLPEWMVRWQAVLFDNGWLVPEYPPDLGGRNATASQSLAYMEEMASRGLPRASHFPGYAIVAPSLLQFGTDPQRELVRPTLRGDIIWCIGMSEPDAGSDLASLRTTAVSDGAEFVVNGQKVWTSYSMWAQKCFCYVRTDPSLPKHKGISLLIVDMDSSGIEVRPLRHITGSADFAEVFFSDVRVPTSNLVGELNEGWSVTVASLGHERNGLWVRDVTAHEHTLDALVQLAQSSGRSQDPVLRRKIGSLYAQVMNLRALGHKGATSLDQGGSGSEHSYLKLAASELGMQLFELGMEIRGGAGFVTDPAWTKGSGNWAQLFLWNFANTIAGGTSEIQRNIIAERILGLPKG
jgi:alkylation response protein AidB-like acyl-CoA dehydrogenase